MLFDEPLAECVLARRYKRFLADVEFPDGSALTVHCPNPGAMMGLNVPGSRAWISDSKNPKRKLRHTLELLEIGNTMVGINTNRANRLAVEAISAGRIPALADYDRLRTEVRYGANSRIDILLEKAGRPDTYVEVKNVHLVRRKGLHEFPDSVTARGAKHLAEMSKEVERGNRAVMLYVIQRNDGDRFAISGDLDPHYRAAFTNARIAGVEAFAIRCNVTPLGIDALDLIPIEEDFGMV